MGILDRLFKGKAILKWLNHRNLYLLGLATTLCGLGWSNALMSIGQFILLGNWIIELNFKQKLKQLKSNKAITAVLLLYLIHLLGLLWTQDIGYAIKDLRVKIPLLALPIIIGSSQKLNAKEWRNLLGIYIGTLFILTLASLAKYLQLFDYNIIDKRELSIYISHIRYGLNLALAVLLLFYFRSHFPKKIQALLYTLAAWFVLCLLLFSLLTGFLTLCFIGILIGLKEIRKRVTSVHLNEMIGISIFFILVSSFLYVKSVYNDFSTAPQLNYNQNEKGKLYTEGGELYWSEFDDQRMENGIYVRRFIAWKEIEREWNKRSKLDFWQQDLKGQTLDQTLNRFLASKGLKKDSIGISKLSDKEILAIEKGIANQYFLTHSNLQNRIFKTLFEIDEYRRTGIADGFSLALRYEYWQAAFSIIKEDIWLGVGTGDIKEAFVNTYELNSSKLSKKYRKRSHNQYLTIWATFGLIGLVIFLIGLFYPLSLKAHHAFYPYFLILMCLSFITEDTLETQAGVSLFALFNCLLLLALPQLKDSSSR